uniref:Uncharacterized protein n=1 Tax=Fagus sylvatica TaxID=28930 RepID=A0A2N9IGH7_FAGSY
MEMMYYQLARSSYRDSKKVLEADIQHANALYIQMVDQTYLHMAGRQPLGTFMLLYYHLFNGSMVAWMIWILLKKRICVGKVFAKRGWKEMEDSPMSIWTEKMNVGFAWSLAPKWFCLIAVMQCASNAIAIGTQGRSPALFVVVA